MQNVTYLHLQVQTVSHLAKRLSDLKQNGTQEIFFGNSMTCIHTDKYIKHLEAREG